MRTQGEADISIQKNYHLPVAAVLVVSWSFWTGILQMMPWLPAYLWVQAIVDHVPAAVPAAFAITQPVVGVTLFAQFR